MKKKRTAQCTVSQVLLTAAATPPYNGVRVAAVGVQPWLNASGVIAAAITHAPSSPVPRQLVRPPAF